MVDSKLAQRRNAATTTRRYFDEETKRNAVEAMLRGDKTRQQICAELEIQPSQLLAWLGLYGERQRAYNAVEAATVPPPVPTLPALGGALSDTISGAVAGALRAGVSGAALHDEIAKAVGNAVLRALAEQRQE